MTAVFAGVPMAAVADSGSQTYELVISAPNLGTAPNGDMVAVTGGGTFGIHPKTVDASGEFTHTDAGGDVVGAGTWTATELLAFHSYGCGIVTFPDPDVILPENFCGGMLKLRVDLTTSIGTFEGILTIFCIIGDRLPGSHSTPEGEGVTLNIPGGINFNHTTAGGTNAYIKTSG